jgi:MFS family permease
LIALFVAMPVLASAVIQVPIGALSDKVDRRYVMIGHGVPRHCGRCAFHHWLTDVEPAYLIGFALMFGMAIFTLFPLAVAHANDHATPDAYVRTSGGLLLLFGLGSIVGPLLAGAAMGQVGPSGLFMVTLAAHIGLLVYTIYRISRRAGVARDEKSHFAATPTARNTTPQTTALRTGDDVYFIEDEFHEGKW